MQFIEAEIKRCAKLLDDLSPSDLVNYRYYEGRMIGLTWVLKQLNEPAAIHDMEEGVLKATWEVIQRNEFEQLKRQTANQIVELGVKFESLQNNFNKLLTDVDKSFGNHLDEVQAELETFKKWMA